MIKKKTMFIFVLILLCGCFAANSAEKNVSKLQVKQWLRLGPIDVSLPIFSDVKNVKNKKFDLPDLLSFETMDYSKWMPQDGDKVKLDKFSQIMWTQQNSDSTGLLFPKTADKNLPQIFFLATYFEANRWLKVNANIQSFHLFEVYLDGEKIKSKTTSQNFKNDSTEQKPEKVTAELKLETGSHLLLIKTLCDPENKNPWNILADFELEEPWRPSNLQLSTSAAQTMDIVHLLDGPKVRDVKISPNGELVAVSLRQSLPPTDNSESWIELRRFKDGSLMHTFRGGMQISNIVWAPTGLRFSYTNSAKSASTLWIVDLENGSVAPILENVEHLGSHSWAPDGSFIIYSISEEPEPDKTQLKRLQSMEDRQPGWRSRSFLYLINIPDGTRKRLTSGNLTTQLNKISPDAKKILFTRSIDDFTERPYSKTQLFVLDLATKKLDSLWTKSWMGDVQWSPDGKKLLLIGGPSLFGELGKNLPEGVIPNDYDNQAYIFDLASKKIEAITHNFSPSINQAVWSKTENCIYFTCIDRAYQRLYSYNLKNKKFELINTGVEVLGSIDFCAEKPVAIYTGSSANVPSKIFAIDLSKKKHQLFYDSEESDFKNVKFGKVESWVFRNERNVEIDGRIYYPPDFDSTKQYPCIVYYYGGTSPVTREFGGRYPKNLYAANGYVVYVLQPSGAVGFGQEFSALHVNDWGKIVADEIIAGAKKFLDTHPFVDKTRVGCLGASYGGFMTMLIQTKTDMFTAAIAHAGISMLPSYWGEGFWGYSYSAVATANSFPWNRSDIYVEQSPLFHADKIQTPLLLLHGAEDTNVPPGESIQLYTALKLLGKEVELIEVEDQNHHIMAYNRRKLWTKTILAWFDKWLKDEPQWWNDLYSLEK